MISRKRDLLGLAGLERTEIEHLLDSAAAFKAVLERPVPKVPTLRGQTVANLFFENSTRTRISFELAEKRLSADVVNFSASGSSVSKGESLLDTARNVQAMQIDMIVIRHSSPGAPHFLASHLDAAVINAGDGAHEHPTQALLDLLTMREHKGRIGGLRVALIGDIQHSRVARSNLWGLMKLGAEVTLCGPTTLMPAEIDTFGCRVTHRVEEAVEGADVVMALRIQLERQRQGRLPSLREYARLYGLTLDRVKIARPDVLIMHPGPINRGIEISQEVADGPGSVILEQVTNGVAARMAVLFRASGLDPGVLEEVEVAAGERGEEREGTEAARMGRRDSSPAKGNAAPPDSSSAAVDSRDRAPESRAHSGRRQSRDWSSATDSGQAAGVAPARSPGRGDRGETGDRGQSGGRGENGDRGHSGGRGENGDRERRTGGAGRPLVVAAPGGQAHD